MADLNRKMAEGHTVSDLDTVIDEVYGAHGDYDTLGDRLDDIDTIIDTAKLGIHYKGEVNYYSNLPTTGVSIGDAYTVKYAGSSGTTPDGTEYVWGTVSGTNQWINFSKDSYTKAEVDALLALKQNALTTAQLAAVNSGIDSTKVAQIETNKTNILYNTNMGVKNLAPVSIVDKIATSEGFTVKTNCRLTAGDYVISFDYTSTSSATPAFFNSDGGLTKQLTAINGSGHKSLPFTVTSQNDIAGYYFYTVRAAKFDNIMIRPALIEDGTFEPYAMSNAELTAKEQVNENNISYLENTGKKNWLKPDTISGVPTGLTVQYESDDSITINGTYSGSGYAYVHLHSFAYEAMQYTLSCNVATSASTFYFFTLDNKMSTNITPTYIYTENGTTRVVMRIAPNTSFDNVNVKLMIRPSIITDSTYQPYAMSNAELTAAIQALQAQLANG